MFWCYQVSIILLRSIECVIQTVHTDVQHLDDIVILLTLYLDDELDTIARSIAGCRLP